MLLLIAGAALNVAVAWAAFLSKPGDGGMTHREPNRDDKEFFFRGHRPDARFVPSEAVEHYGPTERGLIVKYTSVNGSGAIPRASKSSVGWPLVALGHEQWVEMVGIDPKTGSGIWKTVGERGQWKGVSLRGFDFLPVLPVWPGFAINALFYAAVLWMMLFGPFVLRRRLRCRRGLCPTCAYPIGRSPLCTECGAPIPSAARNSAGTTPRSLSRRFLTGVLWLLAAGAAVNVAVAWCGVVLYSWRPSPNRQAGHQTAWAALVHDNETASEWWLVSRVDSAMVTMIQANQQKLPRSLKELTEVHPSTLLPSWASDYGDPRPLVVHGKWTDLGGYASGWPCRALFCEHEKVDFRNTKERGGYRFRYRNRQIGKLDILPLIPIWPGFAVNTMFFAGVLWVLFAGPFALRRLIRGRRGRCAACTCPIGTSNAKSQACGDAIRRDPRTVDL